jgi:uncharacterized protein YwgA
MKATEFLMSIIDASGGNVNGRTLLQKKVFFVSELAKIDPSLGFDAHFYGPYSATVEGTMTQLKNLGFVQESNTGFGSVADGFEIRRYDYSLTEDGKKILEELRGTPEYQKVKNAVGEIASSGDPNYVELSIAAKAYFLLKGKNESMSISELQKQAEHYNWNISPNSIKKAMSFLKSVGLAS